MPVVSLGPVRLSILEGDLRGVTFDGVEVLRRLSYPVRDPNWGTHPTETLREDLEEGTDWLRYTHQFRGRGDLFAGTFRVEVRLTDGGAVLRAEVGLEAACDLPVNRAGFTLLHPLRGVSGTPLTVRHAAGAEEATVWPRLISPGQPVFDIAGLAHEVEGVRVEIGMAGEVFEMEDQRNWTDASFKTYCRPLARPLPFALGPDAPVRQEVTLRLSGAARRGAGGVAAKVGRVPRLAVAVEAGLTTLPRLPALPDLPRLIRLRADAGAAVLAGLGAGPEDRLEIVLEDGDDPTRALQGLAARVAAAGIVPREVVALRAAYMKSHQPSGPWPEGPRPMDLIAPLRAAFPGAAVGGGMFTNFTEFNRCPPDPARVDFVTWGGTAIVHAGDDLSVMETLEALPEVFASGRALAGGRPLHLGLFSIGMRSNPYAADCLPNPGLERLAMVRDDPRQGTVFAAAFAVGVLAAAVEEGVESLALSMTDGPLGATARLLPVLRWIAARVGDAVSVRREGARVEIVAGDGRLVGLGGDAGVRIEGGA